MNQQNLPNNTLVALNDEEIRLISHLLNPSLDSEGPSKILHDKLHHALSIKVDTIFVSDYETVQHYGGPEEGGWYYYTKQLGFSTGFTSLNDAVQHVLESLDSEDAPSGEDIEQAWKEKRYFSHWYEQDRYGQGIEIVLETYPGEYEDKGTPHYE